ncbi:hypothetical protein PN498_22885 [Oscillatoria sp. CS-180]|uniref:hypothetical protein n=1 Tax=Oscillatoria sp. CS-180 TaxID=3021720 RepID=UPI00232CA3E4|nr:hypothetical protein [Oscillatoria sp. CS-180]MDB9528857.1 hypothetical protein [Oscillatoria sp. CS-180]
MSFGIGSKNDIVESPNQHDGWVALWHRLTLRLVLVLGVVVFLTAVGIDSLHQAAAADMPKVSIEGNPVPSAKTVNPSSAANIKQTSRASYLTFDAETAHKLGHSDLTSASLTRSRLTSSHLFTPYGRRQLRYDKTASHQAMR